MNEEKVLQLIADLGPNGAEAFSQYVGFLYFDSVLRNVANLGVVAALVCIAYLVFKYVDKREDD